MPGWFNSSSSFVFFPFLFCYCSVVCLRANGTWRAVFGTLLLMNWLWVRPPLYPYLLIPYIPNG